MAAEIEQLKRDDLQFYWLLLPSYQGYNSISVSSWVWLQKQA